LPTQACTRLEDCRRQGRAASQQTDPYHPFQLSDIHLIVTP